MAGEKGFLAGAGQGASATEIAISLHKIPALLTTWTRCGKPNCRCNAGRLHGPYHVMHWREGKVQRRRYVRAADVEAVRAVIEARRAERRAERLAFALAMGSWREHLRWVAECEAALRDERTGR
jgi:hypothetical protein